MAHITSLLLIRPVRDIWYWLYHWSDDIVLNCLSFQLRMQSRNILPGWRRRHNGKRLHTPVQEGGGGAGGGCRELADLSPQALGLSLELPLLAGWRRSFNVHTAHRAIAFTNIYVEIQCYSKACIVVPSVCSWTELCSVCWVCMFRE